METRIALIGIIVENPESVESLNAILHDYSEFIIGRMGIPYKQRSISVISVIVDAPTDVISALSGKLGMLPNVNANPSFRPFSLKKPADRLKNIMETGFIPADSLNSQTTVKTTATTVVSAEVMTA